MIPRPSCGGETTGSTVPQHAGHYLAIDQTRWVGMTVDARATVNEQRAMELSLSHFLLRIVVGELL